MNARAIVALAAVGIACGAAAFRAGRPPSAAPPVLVTTSGATRTAATPPAKIAVYVAGHVTHPGVYRFAAGARAEAALAAAGGASSGADPVAVNLAEPLRDGEEIVVPALESAGAMPGRRRRPMAAASYVSRQRPAGAGSKSRSGRSKKAEPSSPVDVNKADAAELATLPGIGPRLAERIVAMRETSGPFAGPDDLLDVAGVSERLLERIAPYTRFNR